MPAASPPPPPPPPPLTENALLKSNQIAKGYIGYGASERARASALARYWVYRKFAEFTPCEQPTTSAR